jgi:MFS transporter, DHA1 family, multidrug resistance protein
MPVNLSDDPLSPTQNSVLTYLADAYPTYAASVLAGNGFIRAMFGATFPLFTGAMYRNLGVGWASTLLALLACVFVPIPILLYKYGERIRMASKHARHNY